MEIEVERRWLQVQDSDALTARRRPIIEKARDGTWRNDVTVNLGRGHGDSPVTLIEKHDMHFKSELKSILAGDDLKHVLVRDMRHDKRAVA